MTTPPPSEGPSPEELKQAHELLARLPYATPPCGICAEADDHAEAERNQRALDQTNAQTLALALREAKRSAHLEDARAGCRQCAVAPPYRNKHALVPAAGWMHTDGKYVEFCARPEVWDALSLPPGPK